MIRKILLALTLICLCCTTAYSSDDMVDFDYNFIDNAFNNAKPATNQQFDEAVKHYETKRNRGLFYGVKKFFNKNNPAYDDTFKSKYEVPAMQLERPKNPEVEKPSVIIGTNVMDSQGNILPAGHYQIEKEEKNGIYKINLFQGSKKFGTVNAKPFEDNWQTPAIIYSRVVGVNDSIIKLIYSNMDITIYGILRAAP